jgi:hypothetical protein
MRIRTYGQQKAALTRASRGPGDRYAAVRAACVRTITEWNSPEWAAAHKVRQGAWPDDWARWQRALDDASPGIIGERLEDLV